MKMLTLKGMYETRNKVCLIFLKQHYYCVWQSPLLQLSYMYVNMTELQYRTNKWTKVSLFLEKTNVD